jgi:O-antigen ligase
MLATIYLFFRFSTSTAILALFASVIGVAIAIKSKKIASHLVAGVFVLLILAMPFGVHHAIGDKTVKEVGQIAYDMKLPNSAINRLIIWQFSTKKIFEKPVTGWGMNTARNIPGGNDKYTLRVADASGKEFTLFREFFVPLHTHNQALQIWLELGTIGAILVAGFGWLFIRKLGRPETHPAVFGVVISILAFNFLSFGAWQSWWIATQFLCISLAIAATKRET